MDKSGLILDLKRKGFMYVADCVAHSCLPRQTVASLEEIEQYVLCSLPEAAKIIKAYRDKSI